MSIIYRKKATVIIIVSLLLAILNLSTIWYPSEFSSQVPNINALDDKSSSLSNMNVHTTILVPTNSELWNITNITIIKNQRLVVNESILVNENGSLILYNSTIMLFSNNSDELWINVLPGGNLTIINSTITSYNMTNNYYIIIQNNASFYMENSEISYAGISWSGEKEKSGLWINTSNAVIERNRFRNNLCGVYIANSHNNVIVGNTFSANNLSLYMFRSSNNLIANNMLVNNTVGITTDYRDAYSCPGISLYESHNNILLNNTMTNNTVGMLLLFSNNNNVTSNIFSNNDVGIWISVSNNTILANNIISNNDAGLAMGRAYNNTITRNTISSNYYDGVYIFNSENNTVTNNMIANSTFGVYAWYVKRNSIINNFVYNNTCGICLLYSRGTEISNNTIVTTPDNIRDLYFHIPPPCCPMLPPGLTGKTLGVLLCHSRRNSIINNTVAGSYYGIYLYDSYQNTVINNTITNSSCGVYIHESESNLLTDNVMTNNVYNMLLAPSALDYGLATLVILIGTISLVSYLKNKRRRKTKEFIKTLFSMKVKDVLRCITNEIFLWRVIISIVGILFLSQVFTFVLKYVYLRYVRYDDLLLYLAVAILVIVLLGAIYGPVVGFSVGFFGVILSNIIIFVSTWPLNHLYSGAITLMSLVFIQNMRYGLYGLLPGLTHKAVNKKFRNIEYLVPNAIFGFWFYTVEYLWATNYPFFVLQGISACAILLSVIIICLLRAIELAEVRLSERGIVHPIFPHYIELKRKLSKSDEVESL
ncbi:MAG: right-handed parallel beta-helix repeat-containing protein [Candidatus Asgardarchaeia archaeon]